MPDGVEGVDFETVSLRERVGLIFVGGFWIAVGAVVLVWGAVKWPPHAGFALAYAVSGVAVIDAAIRGRWYSIHSITGAPLQAATMILHAAGWSMAALANAT